MKRFKNILYFADGAMGSCPALERAVQLARSNQARLTLLDVLEPVESPPGVASRLGMDLDQLLRQRRQELLDQLAAPYGEPDSLIYTQVLGGTPFVEVIRAVLRNGHDLVIKAARPAKGLSDRVLGSTDMHLLRKCPCPVWIDRPAAALPYRTVLAAVDPARAGPEDCGRLIMDLASSLARRESARLEVVHAWSLPGESLLRSGRARISALEVDQMVERARIDHEQRLDDLLAPYGLHTGEPAVHLVKGEPATAIGDLAGELPADLIVLGTVGRTGIPGFFIGNTAEEVLQGTLASVLAVKPAGFVSPVRERDG